MSATAFVVKALSQVFSRAGCFIFRAALASTQVCSLLFFENLRSRAGRPQGDLEVCRLPRCR